MPEENNRRDWGQVHQVQYAPGWQLVTNEIIVEAKTMVFEDDAIFPDMK